MAGIVGFSAKERLDREQGDRLLKAMAGEVFDYQSRKQRLSGQGHVFRFPDNDAEYVLHLYEQEGPGAFRELNGSFLVALYHVDSGKLVLATDRLNSRYVFYYCNGGEMAFGSQVRPLLRLPGLPRELDLQAVCEYFTLGRVLGNRTFLQSVRTLPPASVLCLDGDRPQVKRYWSWEHVDEFKSKRFYIAAFSEAMKKAVERRTRGGHRLGLLLSGGLDSRTVLHAAEKGRISAAFTIADYPNRELKTARRIAAARGCRHVFLQRDLDYYRRIVHEAVAIGDGMYPCHHAHNLGFFDTIREHADVLIHGFGFDVLFKASTVPLTRLNLMGHGVSIPVPDIMEDASLEEVVSRILQYSLVTTSQDIFIMPPGEVTDLLRNSVEALHGDPQAAMAVHEARRVPDYLDSLLDLRQFSGFFHVTHNRAYMDERMVSSDNDLLESALSIPTRLKTANRLIKGILPRISPRAALVTNANTGLPAATPPWIEAALLSLEPAARKRAFKPEPPPHPAFTKGSWSDYAELIRHNRKLNTLMLATIEDEGCLDPRIFNVDRIREIFFDHIEGREDHSEMLFLLLTFGQWHKEYGKA